MLSLQGAAAPAFAAQGKDIQIGVIDVASDTIETGGRRCDHRKPCSSTSQGEPHCQHNCGMAPMRREIAAAKLGALGRGAALARKRFA